MDHSVVFAWFKDQVLSGKICDIPLQSTSVQISKKKMRASFERWRRKKAPDSPYLAEAVFSKALVQFLPMRTVQARPSKNVRRREFVVPSLKTCQVVARVDKESEELRDIFG